MNKFFCNAAEWLIKIFAMLLQKLCDLSTFSQCCFKNCVAHQNFCNVVQNLYGSFMFVCNIQFYVDFAVA